MDLVTANINNLKSLWKLAHLNSNSHYSNQYFDYGIIEHSSWPNRLWLHEKPNEVNIKKAKSKIKSLNKKLTIPFWDIYNDFDENVFLDHGFLKVLNQTGMSLQIDSEYRKSVGLTLEKVTDMQAAKQWEILFEQAFGYKIESSVIYNSCKAIDYYIVFDKDQKLGTCVLYYSDDKVLGVHSMGIIPEMRRKGYALKIMQYCLDWAAKKRFQYATLQASDMARELYIKFGFKEQFKMRNYILKEHINQN